MLFVILLVQDVFVSEFHSCRIFKETNPPYKVEMKSFGWRLKKKKELKYFAYYGR